MRANGKLLLGILLALVAIGCAPPSTAATPKIYFDLERKPIALVNELGVDAVVDRYSICYTLLSETTPITGWAELGVFGAVFRERTPIPSNGNVHIPSGSSMPSTGACMFGDDMRKRNQMSAWQYQKGDEPHRSFAVYSDNIDPAAASLHLPVTTSALASSPFQVRFQNTSSMTISVPLNCIFIYGRYLSGDLSLAHLERQTAEGWEVFWMNLKYCSGIPNEIRVDGEWLDIAPQMSGTVDLRSAYPADFVLEKGRYRWVTVFCDGRRNCYTSFSSTFDYPHEQAQ